MKTFAASVLGLAAYIVGLGYAARWAMRKLDVYGLDAEYEQLVWQETSS